MLQMTKNLTHMLLQPGVSEIIPNNKIYYNYGIGLAPNYNSGFIWAKKVKYLYQVCKYEVHTFAL